MSEDFDRQEVDQLRQDIARLLLDIIRQEGHPKPVTVSLDSGDIAAIQEPVTTKIEQTTISLSQIAGSIAEAKSTIGSISATIETIKADVAGIRSDDNETGTPKGKGATKKQREDQNRAMAEIKQLVQDIRDSGHSRGVMILGGKSGRRNLIQIVGWSLLMMLLGFLLGHYLLPRGKPTDEIQNLVVPDAPANLSDTSNDNGADQTRNADASQGNDSSQPVLAPHNPNMTGSSGRGSATGSSGGRNHHNGTGNAGDQGNMQGTASGGHSQTTGTSSGGSASGHGGNAGDAPGGGAASSGGTAAGGKGTTTAAGTVPPAPPRDVKAQ